MLSNHPLKLKILTKQLSLNFIISIIKHYQSKFLILPFKIVEVNDLKIISLSMLSDFY